MKRLALSVTVVGLLVAGAPSAVAQSQIDLAPASAPTFPQRAYRLTVPARRGLSSEDIKVTENGDPVSRLALTSADAARGGAFGAVLVIDASASMHGSAIRGAINAARDLAKRRTGSQQLGIVVFNRTPRILLAPTDDQQAIESALAVPPRLASQTRIFDAVSAALDLLKTAKITAGSVVVLSDGSDTGSSVAAATVATRARRANVAIYTVGLRSRAFDSGELQGLAAAGRGRYAAAASISDLRRIFRDLGAQLASDYLVEYRSLAKPGREVTVAVRVKDVDGIATSTYSVPGDASFVQVRDSFWTSGLGIVLTGLLSAALLALSLGILLVRRGRAPTLRERVQSFVSLPSERAVDPDALLTGPQTSSAERSLERMQWWIAFKRDLEVARIETAPMKIVTVTSIATVVVMYMLILVTGFPFAGLFALGIPWGVRTWVRIMRDRQRTQFTEQLPDVLQGTASAVRAGHGLVASLAIVAEDAAEPSRTEFLRVVADEALGVPLDEALRLVQARMESRDVLQIALVAQIQREAGGNMAEVLDRITDGLRQSGELRRMVKGLTAQGRLSRWVVTALPVLLLLAMTAISPHYVSPLYTTGLGLLLLFVAAVMSTLGSLVIGKIVNFKV